MLLPSLAKAKERALTIQCVNNLKQLGVALNMYGDDNNSLLPMAGAVVPWNSTNPVPWMRTLFDYYQNTNVLRCPAFSRQYNRSPFNYFMGARQAYVDAGVPASVAVKQIHFPSAYILSGDANNDFSAIDADPDNYSQETLFDHLCPAHNERVNILFADFHVKTYGRFNSNEMTYSYSEMGVDFPFVQ